MSSQAMPLTSLLFVCLLQDSHPLGFKHLLPRDLLQVPLWAPLSGWAEGFWFGTA